MCVCVCVKHDFRMFLFKSSLLFQPQARTWAEGATWIHSGWKFWGFFLSLNNFSNQKEDWRYHLLLKGKTLTVVVVVVVSQTILICSSLSWDCEMFGIISLNMDWKMLTKNLEQQARFQISCDLQYIGLMVFWVFFF